MAYLVKATALTRALNEFTATPIPIKFALTCHADLLKFINNIIVSEYRVAERTEEIQKFKGCLRYSDIIYY